jgi:hypothetical protein
MLLRLRFVAVTINVRIRMGEKKDLKNWAAAGHLRRLSVVLIDGSDWVRVVRLVPRWKWKVDLSCQGQIKQQQQINVNAAPPNLINLD